MSYTNNQPKTNNQPDTNIKQSTISDLLTQVLWVHSHLTNTLLPNIKTFTHQSRRTLLPFTSTSYPIQNGMKGLSQRNSSLLAHPTTVQNIQQYTWSVIELFYTQFNSHLLLFPVTALTKYLSEFIITK